MNKKAIEKLTLKHRRPDVYKLLIDLGCQFKYIDEVSLDDLIIDQGIYPRNQTDWERVKLYAEALENGDVFPPILIAERERDFKKITLDGNHRYYANKEVGNNRIFIEVWDVPEALYPVVAQAVNTEEGNIDTPLTPAEKKKAILRDWEILTQYDKKTRKEIIAKILKTSVSYVEFTLSQAGIIRSEKELLKQKAQELRSKGYTYSQIAKELKLSEKTIKRWLSERGTKFSQQKNDPFNPNANEMTKIYPGKNLTNPTPSTEEKEINEVLKRSIITSYEKGTSIQKIQEFAKEIYHLDLTEEEILRIVREAETEKTEETETREEEEVWSDWVSGSTKETQEYYEETEQVYKEEPQEKQQPEPEKKQKSKAGRKKEEKFLPPSKVLENLETKIWQYLVAIEVKFGEEVALKTIEKIYHQYKEDKKNTDMYLDVLALHKAKQM